jgi:hypothetical protein
MYVCGVTPYAPSHLGHAMSYIVFDTVRRYLEFRGYKVKYVQNFTDIDDKIIARANESGVSAKELAQKFIDQYFLDMDALNILPKNNIVFIFSDDISLAQSLFKNFDREISIGAKPPIPIYKKNLILPTNSEIKDVLIQIKKNQTDKPAHLLKQNLN